MPGASPLFGRNGDGFQIDLVFGRADKVTTICEVKHVASPLTTAIIPAVERKRALLPVKRGHAVEKAPIQPPWPR